MITCQMTTISCKLFILVSILELTSNLCARKEDVKISDKPLTRQGALESKRQGDIPCAINNPFTCQGALSNEREWQGDSPCVIATDHNHRFSTGVQNCDLLLTCEYLSRSYEHLLRTYEKLILANCDRLFMLCCKKFDLGLWCMCVIELCLAVYYKYSSSCVLILIALLIR